MMWTRNTSRSIAVVVGILLALTLPGTGNAAAPLEPAQAFISGLADQAVKALTNPDIPEAEREQRARALLNENFAVAVIGEWVLGRYWRATTEAERSEYLRLFEDLIVATYLRRFAAYSGRALRVTGSRSEGDDAVVQSLIDRVGGGNPIEIGWRVRDDGGRLRIVDVIVEGVSMGQTQRAEFGSVVRRHGGKIAGLLDEMRRMLGERT